MSGPEQTVARIIARLEASSGGGGVSIGDVVNALTAAEAAKDRELTQDEIGLLSLEVQNRFNLAGLVLQYAQEDLENAAAEVLTSALEGFDPLTIEADNPLGHELRRLRDVLAELRQDVAPLLAAIRERIWQLPPKKGGR